MKKLSILTLLLLTLFGCRKDVDQTLSTETTQQPTTTTIIDYTPDVVPVTATIFGVVTDEGGSPIAGTTIKLENNNPALSVTTDERGRFVFPNITMNKAGTFLTANKNGYFEGSDRFFPEEGSTNYTKIILVEKIPIGNFVSNDGGTVTGAQGIRLDFPPNSIVDANGNMYTGEVIVAAKWIDPTAENVHEVMPGGLQGINEEAELVALASYGMMAVELESPGGAALNLGNNEKATLTFPVPDEQLNNAPTTIPLWSFSNQYGVWVEEGVATLTDGKYVGEVAHFSWWNVDVPYNFIELSGTLVTENDAPYAYQSICLEVIATGEVGCTNANQDGFFSGPVPKNQEFILTVTTWDGCYNSTTFSMNVGPFSTNTDLGTIMVTAPNNLPITEVTGTLVDCSGNPLTQGWVEIMVGASTYHSYLTNGAYSLSFYNCNNETELTVQATNLVDLKISDVFTHAITNPLIIPEFMACDTQISEWFRTIVDGDTTNLYFIEDAGILGLGDTISIYAYDDLNHIASVNMENVNGIGTYDGSQIVSSYYFLPSTSSGNLNTSCQTGCVYNLLEFDEFGANSGEYVKGNYAGDIEFTDASGNTVTHPLKVEFRVKRN